VNPGSGSGREEPPLDIQVPDDARELARDVLAYHREQRAQRRRTRLRKLTAPFSGRGTIMPLVASVLAVCLVAGAMLSVATFGPSTAPATRPTASATTSRPATASSNATASSTASSTGSSSPTAPSPSGGSKPAASASASGSGAGTSPSGSANSPAGAVASARVSDTVSAAVP
jgi:cytoskeletal protein RodZ